MQLTSDAFVQGGKIPQIHVMPGAGGAIFGSAHYLAQDIACSHAGPQRGLGFIHGPQGVGFRGGAGLSLGGGPDLHQ
jgi:hypothetical protein